MWSLSVPMALHFLTALIWVGGMFFAHMVLRPTATELLEPPQRLPFMLKIFDRFFPWVWLSLIVLLVSGYWMFLGVYKAQVAIQIHIMSGVGLLMAIIFAFIYFAPYKKMSASVEAGDMPQAANSLALIRKLILVNLILGLVISVLAIGGRYI